MEYRLLGPLSVVDHEGREVEIGSGRQRALLALLLLHPGEVLSSDRLIEELWGGSPPATAHKILQNQVSALRRTTGVDGRLETRGNGYRLNVEPGERDVDRFEELIAAAREQVQHDPAGAAAALRDALSLWRGAPLSEFAFESFAQAEIMRLEERRLVAFEQRIEAELALGRHADVVADLEAAVAEHPLRERLQAQLMLALYRCGRTAEALEAYQRAHRVLVDEVGLEPGPELRALQAAVLAQDPALDAPTGDLELPSALEGGSPILVGRQDELAFLADALAEARQGRGGVVLLTGPHGIGKTRLVAELAREALSERVPVEYVGGRQPVEAATAALDRAASAPRVLLVLDDVQLAADPVLDRAAELASEAERRRLLMVVVGREPWLPPAFEGIHARTLALGAVGTDAAERIAALYLAPEEATAPVEELLERSRGVPLELHRSAREWARTQLSGRLAGTAGAAAEGRDRLRAAEAELAGRVIDLQEVDERGLLYSSDDEDEGLPPAEATCPYMGLATFDAAHAELFFGRERLVADMVARLVGASLLAIVGPSGSGKSSAMRAGLLPALRKGVVPGSQAWPQALMRPGEHPLEALGRALESATPGSADAASADRVVRTALDGLPTGDRLVIAVDQFEEVFTACRDEAERAGFLAALVAAARDRERRAVVVLAVRADFYGRCASDPDLARLVAANHVLVGPMSREELRRAIENPARRVGLRVDPALTGALLADVLDEPGALPMLSTALLEAWREREGRTMTRAGYERTGGVRAAVSRLAEETYAAMTGAQQAAARRILVRLADAEEGAAFVRRRVRRDELDLQRDEDAATALATLADSRLVTVDGEAVEVAHEALLREWPRLRDWLEEDAEGRRLHQHLIHAARDWQATGQDEAELYRGARLAAVLDWMAQHENDLNELERDFVTRSHVEAQLEAEHHKRANRRLRVLLGGFALLLAVSLVAGAVAVSQRGKARDAAVAADAQRLGAEGLSEDRLDRALLLARAGLSLDDSVATRSNLLAALLRSPAAIGFFHGDGDRLLALALSTDGRRLAYGDNGGQVFVVDPQTRERLVDHQVPEGNVAALDFSPDGRTLAVATLFEGRSILRLLDATSGRIRRDIEIDPFPGDPRTPYHPDAQFVRGGRRIAVGYFAQLPDARPPGYVRQFDVATGRPAGRPLPLSDPGRNLSASEDGRWYVVNELAGGWTSVVDARRDQVVRRFRSGGEYATLSPDGSRLALTTTGGRVRVVDVRSGSVRRFQGSHGAAIMSASFSADGRWLVTGADDTRVIVWDVERGEIERTLEGHAGRVLGVAMSSDGRTVFSDGLDATVIAWDVAGDRSLGRPFRAGEDWDYPFDQFPPGAALSPDGRTLAHTQADGQVQLTDALDLRPLDRFKALARGPATASAWHPSEPLLAVTGLDGVVTITDVTTRRRVGEPMRDLAVTAQTLDFSPDGSLLAAADAEGNVRVWDVRSREVRMEFQAERMVLWLAFSPDGRRLALSLDDLGAEVREVPSGRRVARLATDDAVRTVAFSPDGRLIATGRYDGASELWSAESFERIGPLLEGHSGFVLSVNFSPDERTLATSSTDGTVMLWDVESHTPIGSPLPGTPNRWVTTQFSPDASRLFAVYETGPAVRWEVDSRAWADRACRTAGREITRREWRDAVPGRSYRPVCG